MLWGWWAAKESHAVQERSSPDAALAPMTSAAAENVLDDTLDGCGDQEGRVVPAETVPPPGDCSRAMRHLHAVVGALAARMGALESRFSLAATSLSGLTALQAAVEHDNFVEGRSLAACARSSLMDKLHACPPKPRASSGRTQADQSKVRVEVVCSLSAMEQMIDLGKLVHTTKRHPLPGRQALRVELSGFNALADAIMMTPSMRADAQARTFRRGAETRLVIEHVKTDEGRTIYVLERLLRSSEVRVASRASEAFDGRLKRYTSSAEVKVVKADEVPGLPESYPASMTWTEGRHGVASTVGGHRTSVGKLVFSVPVSIALGKAADLVALLNE